MFTVNVSGGDPNAKLTYNWKTSTGVIISGQDTPTIAVKVNKRKEGGFQWGAVVNVYGLNPSCTSSASCFVFGDPPPASQRFGRYGKLTPTAEHKQLDLFVDELNAAPGAQGYIVAWPGRRDTKQAAHRRAARAQSYLVNRRGIDPGRIVISVGEAGKVLTVELYIVPAGATPPSIKAH
ncbi:MAG: hypothetical protein ACJ74W_14195 [Pyrinomonadaceae bacterium]